MAIRSREEIIKTVTDLGEAVPIEFLGDLSDTLVDYETRVSAPDYESESNPYKGKYENAVKLYRERFTNFGNGGMDNKPIDEPPKVEVEEEKESFTFENLFGIKKE